MSDIISNTAGKLSSIIDTMPVDWEAFDMVLNGLDDINVIDAQDEETILSELIIWGNFLNHGFILPDVVRRFLSCGYDVSANNGLNGGLALQALCLSSYDQYILDAAKVLMAAGAPARYRTRGDDIYGEPTGLLGSIRWWLSGAWMADKDYPFANILEAYYAITEANLAGKDYHSIDSYFACMGKPLTAVSAINTDGKPALHREGAVSVYSEPLILWFADQPLVVSCYTDFVMNPVFADEKKDALVDVSAEFSSLIGATLREVQYFDTSICYFAFSNGKHLLLASRSADGRKRVGTFEIRTPREKVDVESLHIECICGLKGRSYGDTVTEYCEDSVALFCEDGAYLLYLTPGTGDRAQLSLYPCSKAMLAEYSRQYPPEHPSKTTWLYEQELLSAIRLDFPEGHLYLTTDTYAIELQLSDRLYDPLKGYVLPFREGKHVVFREREP